MADHTNGKVRTDLSEHDAPYQDIHIVGSDGHKICTVWIDDALVPDYNSLQYANARHMVACWNARAGIDTKFLEDLPDGLLSASVPYHELKVKCDELLRARRVLGAENIALRDQAPNSQAARDVLAERQRQVSAEGWTPEHDDEHSFGELARAGAAYAAQSLCAEDPELDCGPPKWWPWDRSWWKPTGRRRMLVKAGALILAEIERLDRCVAKKSEVS